MAPEITLKKEYDGKAVDMWALGVLLYVMLTGVFPFKGSSESDLYNKI
jgi:serine/threonine protein kinase